MTRPLRGHGHLGVFVGLVLTGCVFVAGRRTGRRVVSGSTFRFDSPAARQEAERFAPPRAELAKSRGTYEIAPVDAAALTAGLGDYLGASMREALAPGVDGWWEDNCNLRPWGFSLRDITVPVLLLHGRQDGFVPFGHGEWLAAHIPGVEARLFDDDGHLSLLQNRLPEVHAWLSDRL